MPQDKPEIHGDESYVPEDVVIFLVPDGIELDSDLTAEIITTGSLSARAYLAENASATAFMIVTDDELNFIVTNLRFFDFDPIVMLGAPGAVYTNNWDLAAAVAETEDYAVFIANIRDANAKTHEEISPVRLRVSDVVTKGDIDDAASGDEPA